MGHSFPIRRTLKIIAFVSVCAALSACGRAGEPTAPAPKPSPTDQAESESEKGKSEENFFLDWLL